MLSKKQYHWSTYTLAWILVCIVACYFRLYPLREFRTDDAREKATVYVLSQLKIVAAQQIEKSHPNANTEKKAKLAKVYFDKLLRTDRDNVRQKIDNISESLSQSSPPQQKTPYLLASDSFYYFHLTENILETGKISPKIKGSKYLNEFMLAPEGHWEPLNFHPFIGVFIYKLAQLFDKDIALMYAVSFTPIVITCLALLIFIAICRNLNFHPLIALTGAIFFSLAPVFIRRSTFGWYDNDPYNTLFPLLIFWLLFCLIDLIIKHAADKKNNYRKLIGFTCALFLSVFIYSLFWHGWMLFFIIVFTSLILTTLYNFFILKNTAAGKMFALGLIVFTTGAFLSIGIIFGFGQFFILFKEGWIALQNFLTPQLSNWPDLYISVGELSRSTVSEMIKLTGGTLFSTIAALGVAAGLYQTVFSGNHTKDNSHAHKMIVITTGLAASVLITLGAQRFALLMLAPIAIFFMIGLNTIYTTIINRQHANQSFQKTLKAFILIAILSLTFVPTYHINKNIATYLNPIFNKTWEEALIYLRDNTPENSIINTWWPPGHFIKAIAQRRVTFDGASINYPQAYWISNMFLSQTEDEALGYIRMLNNSGNKAIEYLQNDLDVPLSTAVMVIKQIISVDELKARFLLGNVLKDKKHINNIITLTHKRPPPSYLLLYKEFVDNNLQLGFVGRWNFKRIEEINANPELIKKVPDRNSPEYIDFLWELSGGQTKYSGTLALMHKDKDKLIFQENIVINTETMSCLISSDKYGKGIPQSIFYSKKGKVIEKKLVGANLSYSIVLNQTSQQPSVVLMDRSLANSLLIKLYFFNAEGLNYIKPVYAKSDLTKRTEIMIFKVDWDQYYTDFLKRLKAISKDS